MPGSLVPVTQFYSCSQDVVATHVQEVEVYGTHTWAHTYTHAYTCTQTQTHREATYTSHLSGGHRGIMTGWGVAELRPGWPALALSHVHTPCGGGRCASAPWALAWI